MSRVKGVQAISMLLVPLAVIQAITVCVQFLLRHKILVVPQAA
jgi:hypothetical protein